MEQHSQFELFPGKHEPLVRDSGPRFFLRNITLSLETCVFLIVFMIIAMIFSFSIGVERGKRIVRKRSFPPKAEALASKADLSQGLASENIVLTKASVAGNVSVPILETVPEPSDSARADAGQNLEKDNVPTDIKGVYTIQVASYKKDSFAQEEAVKLRKKGYETLVLLKGKYSIVCVGKFSHKEEAVKMSNKLKTNYKDCLIRSL